MAENRKITHFFRVILPCIIQDGTLELPENFVKEYGKHFSMYARLKVPTGSESKIQLKRCNGQAWLDKGWPDFVHKYSIKCGYFLMFQYEGGSRFNVLIFDLSTSEIEYPLCSPRSSKKKVGECKIIEVEEDSHDHDVEISDDCAVEIRKGGEMNDANKSSGVGGEVGATSARERVLERAMAFESRNPHFTVIMQPVYVSGRYNILDIPAVPARTYFLGKENHNISLKGAADGRVWPMTYFIGAPPRQRVRFYSGWNKFSRENHLRVGDTCVFELVNRKAMAFKVTIFRITDEQFYNGMPDAASRQLLRTPPRNGHLNIRSGSFRIYMSSYYISRGANVHIPVPHCRRYLMDKDGENIIIIHGLNGRTWSVKYRFSSTTCRAAFMHGWKEFASDNNLQRGDICVFEMILRKVREYKVTISRAADRT